MYLQTTRCSSLANSPSLFLYEKSVAVLKDRCYVFFATVNFVVHRVARGGNDSGRNDNARGEVQWYNWERMLPVSLCTETVCASNQHPGSAEIRGKIMKLIRRIRPLSWLLLVWIIFVYISEQFTLADLGLRAVFSMLILIHIVIY